MKSHSDKIVETYVSPQNPYRYGSHRKSPGFGFGTTGQGGGFTAVVRPLRTMGASGANLMKFNPMKPYSDEFSSELQGENQRKWQKATTEFEKSYQNFRDDIKFANTPDKINDILLTLNGEDLNFLEPFVDDYSMYKIYAQNKEVEKMKRLVLSGVEKWKKNLFDNAANMDFDTENLERFTYKRDTHAI